jgi:hypothetical protein
VNRRSDPPLDFSSARQRQVRWLERVQQKPRIDGYCVSRLI